MDPAAMNGMNKKAYLCQALNAICNGINDL